MRPSRSSLTLAVLGVGLAAPLWAQTVGEITEGGAAFLLLAVGGRATALGQAAVADGGTGEAAFWNPAGLALLPSVELDAHYASTFASNNAVLSGYLPSSRFGVVGVAAYLVDYGRQEVVPPGGGQPIGTLSPKNIELLASYATPLGAGLSLGVNYKLIQLRNDCSGDCGTLQSVVGTTHAVDIGAQYGFGPSNRARVGVVVRHAGFDLQLENASQADPLPTRLAVGMAYTLDLPRLENRPPSFARVLLDLENGLGHYANPDVHVGGELGYGDVIRLRGGYAFLHSQFKGPSLGVGLLIDRLSLDFARTFFVSGNFDEPVYLSLRIKL